MNNEEEDLFCRYPKESGADNGIWWICPYTRVDQVRIPWCGRNNSNLQEVSSITFRRAVETYSYEEEDLVKPKRSGERVVAKVRLPPAVSCIGGDCGS